MKLINLNLQGGVVFDPLMKFIKEQSLEIDVFCFQEVFHNTVTAKPLLGNVRLKLFSELKDVLLNFNGYYTASLENDVGGLAIFIKKSFVVNKADSVVIFPELNITENENDNNYFSMGRNLQCIEFNYSGKIYTIFNFHGIWIAKGKKDTERRILQSKRVRKILDESKGIKILCTDLNVTPETESMAILNEGNRNLVCEYKITSTRSFLKNRSEVVDYIIVSPDTEVKGFKVLQDKVSDHLPLILEFE
jgi:endonuclease/exonuclease/phosphatase family metal-dependent hydrolase